MRAHIILGTALSVLVLAGSSRAAEIKVMNSGGFAAAYKELAPACERAGGHTVDTAWGASMGTAPDAIPMRLSRGEPADVLIMAAPALDELIRQGKAIPGSRTDLARSTIAMAVKSGARSPTSRPSRPSSARSSRRSRSPIRRARAASISRPRCFRTCGTAPRSWGRVARS